jgi:hypothetical protein
MFLLKQPSKKTRVLNYDLCPPHNVVHDVELYPVYYDALYFPHYHPGVFATPDNFCLWLHACLSSHREVCLSCRPLYNTTTVFYDGSAVCVRIDNTSIRLLTSFFESAFYSHCSVFRYQRYLHFTGSGSVTAVNETTACRIASHTDVVPSWLTYTDDYVRSQLIALPQATLSSPVHQLCEPNTWF